MRKTLLSVLTFLVIAGAICPFPEAFAQTSQSSYEQGMVYLKQGYLREAETSFRMAIYLNKTNAMAYARLGYIYRLMNRFEEAIDACKKAIALKPDLYEAYATMGSACYELGQNDEALSSCKKALAFNPDLPEAYFTIAQVYLAFGNYKTAKENALMARDLFQKKGMRDGVADVESFLETLTTIKKQ